MNGLILSAWNPHISKVQWSKTRIASTGLSAAKTLGGFEQQEIGCQHLKLVLYSGYIWMLWWILWWIYGKFKVLKWDGLDVFGQLGDLRWIYLKSDGWNETKKHNQGDPLCRLMGYTYNLCHFDVRKIWYPNWDQRISKVYHTFRTVRGSENQRLWKNAAKIGQSWGWFVELQMVACFRPKKYPLVI